MRKVPAMSGSNFCLSVCTFTKTQDTKNVNLAMLSPENSEVLGKSKTKWSEVSDSGLPPDSIRVLQVMYGALASV